MPRSFDGGGSGANVHVMVLTESMISGRTTTDPRNTFGGGGIFLFDAVALIANTAVVENESAQRCRNLIVRLRRAAPAPGTAITTILNSTVSGNISPNES